MATQPSVYAGDNTTLDNIAKSGQRPYNLTKEVGYDLGYSDGYALGYTEGYAAGFTAGFTSGYASGHADGLTEGFTTGHAAGYAEGYADGNAAAFSALLTAQQATAAPIVVVPEPEALDHISDALARLASQFADDIDE
jgi:flagellar biosynthesis/type III secretory pathway protein FliH